MFYKNKGRRILSFVLLLLLCINSLSFNVSAEVGTSADTVPVLSSASIRSSNLNPSVAKVGDTITVSITASEDLKSDPSIRIINKDATVTIDSSGDKKIWTGKYKLTEDDTAGPIGFTIDFVSDKGIAGKQVASTTDASYVKFYKAKPVITLNDPLEVTIKANSNYIDPATAKDGLNGDLTSKIMKTGAVDITKAGNYIVKYNVADPAGNQADEKIKTVIVQPAASDITKPGVMENMPVGFSSKDFPLAGDTLEKIRITSLPAYGQLMMNSSLVSEDQVVNVSDLNVLSYIPESGFAGSDSFKWVGASQQLIYSSEATITFTSAANSSPLSPGSFTSPQSGLTFNDIDSITVNWGASTDPEGGEVNYVLELSLAQDDWNQVYSGNGTSYIYSGTAGLNSAAAQFRVKAIDEGGLSSVYTVSDTFAINSTLPKFDKVTIASDNKNSYAAKIGDTVTVSITSSEELVSEPVIKIAGKDVTAEGSGRNWTGLYKMTESDTSGQVSFSVGIEGDPGSEVTAVTEGKAVKFYKTIPVITLDYTEVTILAGSTYTDGTTGTDCLGENLTSTLSRTVEVNTAAAGTYTVKYNLSDAAGNSAVEVTKTVHVQSKAFNSTKSGIVEGIPAKFSKGDFSLAGDTLSSVKITYVPDHGTLTYKDAGTGLYTEVVLGAEISTPELDTLVYTVDSGFFGDDSFKWTGMGSQSIESNEAAVTLSIEVNSPPTGPNSFLLPLSGQSYKGGGSIMVQWEASNDPEGSTVSYSLEFSSDGENWKKVDDVSDTSYTYNIPAELNTDKAQFRVKAKDAQGHESGYTLSNVFTIDNTIPSLDSVTITSSNANPSLAKVGDEITVSITSVEDLASKPSIKIAGNDAFVSGDKKTWTGIYRMTKDDGEGVVSISVDYTDTVGNAGVQKTAATDGSAVIFDKTPPVITLDSAEVTIPVGSEYKDGTNASDSQDGKSIDLTGSIVKSGDEVTTGVVGIYSVTYNVADAAGNLAVPVTKTIYVQPIASNSTKTGIVGNIPKGFSADEFTLTGDTVASIIITQLPSPPAGKLMLKGFAVIQNQVIPISELGKLNYRTDNSFDGVDVKKYDSFKWAGIGAGQVYSNEATMNLVIDKNKPPTNPESITGVAEGQRFAEGRIDLSWEASADSDGDASAITYTLEFFDGSDWKVVYTGPATSSSFNITSQMNIDNAQFRIKATDEGGVDSILYTESAVFIIDNKAPALSSVTIKSSGSNASFAKTNDAITVEFTSSEALGGTPVVKIAGKDVSASVTSVDHITWSAQYTMTDSDDEGIIQFSIEFADLTGIPGIKVTSASDLSQIVFDRTKPVITLNGLPEVTVEVKDLYADAGAEATEGLTDKIVAVSTVNTDAVGEYTVKYNVTDAAGNAAAEAVRTVHVVDTTKPVIVLNDSPEMKLEVHNTYTEKGATASDNYDGDLTGRIVIKGSVDQDKVGTYTITYDVTDNNGNKAVQVIRTVNVVDTTPPVITITQVDGKTDLTIEVGTQYTDAGATAKDNYDSDADITAKIAASGFVNKDVVGDYTINYDVTDANGNKAEQMTRTVHVVDTQNPVITLKGEPVVTLEVHTPYIDEGATASDNYDKDLTGKIVVNNPVKANVVGTYTVTYDVADSSGNKAERVTRTVIVQDKTRPIITLKGVTQDGNSDIIIQVKVGVYDSSIAKASATATDNYDGDLSSKIIVDNPVNVNIVGVYTVTFNVTDANGNSALPVTRKVYVVDTQKPVIKLNGSSPVKVLLGETYTDAGATVEDNYDTVRDIVGTGNVDVNKVGIYTISFTAEDSNKNAATPVNRTVRVVDETPPVITLNETSPGTTDYTMEVHSSYVEPGFTVTDNYDTNLHDKVVISNPVIIDKVGDYTVTYDVKDSSGNIAEQKKRIVHVVDTTKPVITLKGNNIATGKTDVWIEAKRVDVNPDDQYKEPGYTATDNYDGDLTKYVIPSGTVNVSELDDYIIYYNVEDSSHNSAIQATRTVHVVDTIKPVLTLNGASAFSIANGETYTDTLGVTATDNYETTDYLNSHLVISVNGDITADRPVTLTVPGTYVIIYSVSDSSGNAAQSVRRTVYVNGTGGIGPQITVSPSEVDNIEVKTDYSVMTGVTAVDRNRAPLTDLITVAVKDPKGADVTSSISGNIINFKLVGDYVITYHVTEPEYGGSDSEIRVVHVVDTTKPVLHLTGDPVVEAYVHMPYTDNGATATDNYDDPVILTNKIFVKNSVVINQIGEYTITYNVTDANGNAADEITRTVNVVDKTKPVITLLGPSEITLEAKNSTYTEYGAVATDNYDRSCEVQITGSVNTNTVGDYVLTYSATDYSGNEAIIVTRIVHVKDRIGPDITLNNWKDSGATTVTLEVHDNYDEPGATAKDAYDGSSVEVTVSSNLDIHKLGSYTITYTATDARGNISRAYRTVRIVDKTPPVITLLGSANVTLEVHTNYIDATAAALDNYDGNLTGKIFVVNPVISDKVGTYEVTYTVSDANGNTATAARTVNIVDTTKPVITLKGSSVLTIPVGTTYSDAGATASDNYDGDISIKIKSTGTVDTTTVGKYEISFNVSDNHDNTAIAIVRTVYVQPIAAGISKPGVQNVQMKFTSDEFASKLSGDTLNSIRIVTLPSNGTLMNNGEAVNAGDTFDSLSIIDLVYIPNAGRMGKDSFSWSAVGEAGIWSNNAAVSFDIAPNIPPTTPGIFTGFTAGEAFKGENSITIGWGASIDPDGNLGYSINYVLEFYDGTAWAEVDVVTVTSYTYTLPKVNTALARFRVKARDAGNNDSAYQTSFAFTVDSKAPGLTAVKISSNNSKPNYAKAGNEVMVEFTASEPLSASPSVTIAGHNAEVTESGTSWTGKYTLTGADEEGAVPFTIDFSDLVGNEGDTVSTITDSSEVIFDCTKPEIELLGDSPLTIPYDSIYADAGAAALDNIDGDITVNIIKSSTVTNSVGTYTVTYNVKDNAGNSADTVTRTVIVQPKASDGTKAGVENITIVFTLNDFASKYANDTLESVMIIALPANGVLKYNNQVVTGITEIPIEDIDAGKLIYVPNTMYYGADSFKWTAVGSQDIVSSTATMDLNLEANSPPTMPGPITGVSAGQKVKGGSTVTLSWLASNDTDNGGVSLQYILESSTDGNNWTVIYSGIALTTTYSIPVTNVDTAQFRVKAKDAGEFVSQYRDSAIYTIDSTPPVLTNVHIASNNANTTLAKAADVITVSFESDEDLSSLPVVTIAGKSAAVTGSGKIWTAKYTMGIGDGEGPVSFTIDFKDIAGNNGTRISITKDSSSVIFDRTKPVLSLTGLSLAVTPYGVPYNDAGAKASDSREGDISSSVTAVSSVDTGSVGHYKVTYNVKDAAGNSAASIFRDVDVQPRADNGSVTALENIPYGFQANDFQSCFKGDTVNAIRITSIPSHGTLKNGNTIVINGDDIASITNLTYVPNTGYYRSDSFGWNGMGTKGIRSTDAVMTIDIQENYPPSAPGAFTGITQGQSVKGGTTLKVEFGTSSDSDGDRGIAIRYALEYSSDGNSWAGIYTGTGTSYNHNLGLINTDKAQYRVKAIDGGDLLSGYTYSNIFIIDSSAPVLSPVSISSSNNKHSLAKSGDEITLSFTANEPLKESPVVEIAENAADVTGSGTNWTAKYTMKDSDTEGQIPFSIEFEDLLGNKGSAVIVTTDGSKVIYDRTKPVITITGSDENVEVYSTYADKGASASDNYDNNVNSRIVTSGSVNMSVLGDYIITYSVSDEAGNAADQKIRKVTVTDMTKPVIALKGLSEVNIAVGSVYADSGATVTDNYDSSAEITKKIKVTNSVNKDVVGNYTVTYEVEDAHGNKAEQVTRIIHVIEDKVHLYGKITEKDTGIAIPDAKICLYDMSGSLKHKTTSGASGDYTIDDVILGQYKLVVESQGHSTKSIGIKLAAEDVVGSKIQKDVQLVDFVITLVSNPSSIIGDGIQTAAFEASVTDKDNKPISGITVNFSAEMGTFPNGDFATTDKDGKCSVVYKSEKLEGIDSKRISVKAEVDDPVRNLHASNEIVITYEPSVVKGVVVDNDTGEKVKGAIVEVSKDFNNDGIVDFHARFVTGDDGKYVIAVPKGDENYVIKITKPVQVNGTTKDMTFSQTCAVEDTAGEENKEFSSTNTIAGLLLYKQPDGTPQQLDDYSKYGITVTEQNSADEVPSTIDNSNEKGVFQAEGLENGKTYTVAVTYQLDGNTKIKVGDATVTVSSDGQIGISTILIDPYGKVTDAATGEVISGATVTLLYADTKRNKDAGKVPGSKVALPPMPAFPPNGNANPQKSDSLGQYAFMVPPFTDYLVTAGMGGYQDYTSDIISVEDEIKKWDIKMNRLSSGGSGPVTPPVYDAEGVDRIAGSTRIDTAIEIAKAAFKGKISNVVIARDDIFADALSGSVLAYKYDAPILLVGKTELDLQKVLNYMKNTLDVDGNVFILGEYGAVSTYVEQRLRENFVGVKRIGGADRYETSSKIAEYLNVPKGTPVVIASGEDFPDALSVSGAAAARQYPILIVQPDQVPGAIKNIITDINPEKVFVIGLQGAVSSADEEEIIEAAALDRSKVIRIGGMNRYETSIETARYFNTEGSTVGITTGIDFPDALASSIFGAKFNTPILLVDEKLTVDAVNYLDDRKLTGIVIFGGTGAVNKNLEEQLRNLIIK